MLLDPVKAKGAPLDATAQPLSPTNNNTRRRRGRHANSNHGHSSSSQFEVKPMLGVGAVAGCTECCWHICRPDDTPTTIAAHVCFTFPQKLLFLYNHSPLIILPLLRSVQIIFFFFSTFLFF